MKHGIIRIARFSLGVALVVAGWLVLVAILGLSRGAQLHV